MGSWAGARGSSWAPMALVAAICTGCELVDVDVDGDGGIIISPGRAFDGGIPVPVGDGGLPVPSPTPPGPSPGPAPPGPLPPTPARTPCQMEIMGRGVSFEQAPQATATPAGRPDLVCTVEDPVRIRPVVRGVTFRPARLGAAAVPMFMDCPLAVAIDRMSQMLAERGVTDVVYYAIYSCRVVAGTSTLSEHARARAFDVAAIRRSDGSVATVLTDWEKNQPAPVTPNGRFLREVVTHLHDQRIFNIILTPDYNADHANHFHLDLTPGGRLFR